MLLATIHGPREPKASSQGNTLYRKKPVHTTNKSNEDSSSTSTSFAKFGLFNSLNQAIQKAGYDKPTPIQEQAIPLILAGKDLLGTAQTGTGKTAAFALPILNKLLGQGSHSKSRGIQALILAPTRELAAQIAQSFKTYGGPAGPRTQVVFGGVNKHTQVKLFRSYQPLILVATPGRLLDLMNDRVVRLDQVTTFVLDEADQMLDMGFIHDVRKITRSLPKNIQTLMFSATMPKEIRQLSDQLLKHPERVAVDPVSSTRKPTSQAVYFVEKSQKTALLAEMLAAPSVDRGLVFMRTKHSVNRVVRKLVQRGIKAVAIHGNKTQSVRTRALEDFKNRRVRFVLATDIAARGIDIKELSHVFNYDLPNEPERYVHRIGRTGRAGAPGQAISFCSQEERPFLRSIERLTNRRLDIKETPKSYASVSPQHHQPSGPNPQAAKRHGPTGRAPRGRRHRSSAHHPGPPRTQKGTVPK